MKALTAGRSYLIRGEAYGRTYDYECIPLAVSPDVARFRTRSDPPHDVELRPRYVGGQLGERTGEGEVTICHLAFDGEYVALAVWLEQADGHVLVTPAEY